MDDFQPLAAALRREILAHYSTSERELSGEAGRATLATNSELVPRRALPLCGMLRADAGIPSLAGRSLADLGCGFGGLAVYFAHVGADVVGLDVNGDRLGVPISVCREHGLTAKFGQAAMQDLPLADDSFDVAIMNNSLCYIVDRDERCAALREARRILRPGGYLLIRNPNRLSPLDPFTSMPLIGALSEPWPRRFAGMVGRKRSRVKLVSVPRGRRELGEVGFVDVQDPPSPGRFRPRPVRLFARYQHLLGRNPG